MLLKRNDLIISFCILILVSVLFITPPEGLTQGGMNALAIFIVAIILWSTSAIPLSVTGLLVLALLPLYSVVSSKEAFSYFGNSSVFFIIGVFVLAAALIDTGLSKRIAVNMLKLFGSTPKMLVAGVMLSSAFLSFLMPEHAVAAIIYPVVVTIADRLDLKNSSGRYGSLLFLSLAWGAIIGGVGTLLGGARNPLAIGILEERTGETITFFQWSLAAIPIVFVILFFSYFILGHFFKSNIRDISAARNVLVDELKEMGGMSTKEKRIGSILFATVLLWISVGHIIGLAVISILSATSLFVFGVVDWQTVESKINWSIILMYGGAIALGTALSNTSAISWLVGLVVDSIGITSFMFILLMSIGSLFITEGISNSAAVAIILPIALTLSGSIGLDPVIAVYIIAIPSGLAFMFPISSPPNAIAYSSGYYRIRDIMIPGLIMNIVAWLCFMTMVYFYWPYIGLNII